MPRWEMKPGRWGRHWGVAVFSVLASDGLAERPSSGKGLSEVTLGDLGKGPKVEDRASAHALRRDCAWTTWDRGGARGWREATLEQEGAVSCRAQDEDLVP